MHQVWKSILIELVPSLANNRTSQHVIIYAPIVHNVPPYTTYQLDIHMYNYLIAQILSNQGTKNRALFHLREGMLLIVVIIGVKIVSHTSFKCMQYSHVSHDGIQMHTKPPKHRPNNASKEAIDQEPKQD